MNRIEEKLLDESQHSLFFSTEHHRIDNNLAQLCLQPTNLDIIESDDSDFYILWLTNDDKKEIEILNNINTRIFHFNDDLIDFISEMQASNIFLIIDYDLVSNILSFLDHFAQVIFIYILKNENIVDNPIITDSKRSIRQISNNKIELFRLIIEDIDMCTKDLISSPIFDLSTTEQSSNQSQNVLFIWFYLLIENLFDFDIYNDKSKDDFIEYCRQQYPPDNITQQASITKFENEYSSENAIRWYTRDSFIYRQLNKASRMRDIDALFKFRFFILDFQKQLEQHCEENIPNQFVYRGQDTSRLELIKLKNSVGKYISFNTYLSASIDKEVASAYASGNMSILFEIDVNFTTHLKNKRVRPVYIPDQSDFPQELEVIFPIGSTFLVDSIEMQDNRWNVKLKLTDNNDYHRIVDSAETATFKKLPSKLRFIGVLMLLGDFEKAERCLNMLIENLKSSLDLENLGLAYALLGQIQYDRGDDQCASSTFKIALNNIEPNNIYRAVIYIYLSYYNCSEGNYDIALDYLNQALVYKGEIDAFDLADLYDAFGHVYTEMEEFDNAFIYLNQALELRQSNTSTYPRYFKTYHRLGSVYTKKCEPIKAIQYFKDSLDASLKILPKNHHSLIYSYALVGMSYLLKKNYSLALTYLQKALNLININKPKQNFNPLTYIFVCNMFVMLYTVNRDTTNSFYYAYEAYKVYNQYSNFIRKSSPSIRIIHSNLGGIYRIRHNYTLALDFFFKALDLSSDENNQISTMTRIGKVYFDQGDAEMAHYYLNESLELISKTNQSSVDDDTVFWIHSHLCDVYKREHNFEKATCFAKRNLQLQFDKINKNFFYIIFCYKELIDLCPEQSKNYIEEIVNILQVENLPISFKIYCYTSIGSYYVLKKDYPNVCLYSELSLKYQLMCFPPCYQQLLHTYRALGEAYKWIDGEDSDVAFYYFKKNRDIYIELLNMDEIPINDVQQLIFDEGYIIENIEQSSLITSNIILVYHAISKYNALKGNYAEASGNIQQIEHILNRYRGKKELVIKNTLYSLIASAYKAIENYDKAIFYLEKHITYISNGYIGYGNNFFRIAEVYYTKKDYLMAISKFNIALTFFHNSKFIDHEKLATCYILASSCFTELSNGNYGFIYAEKAIQHFLLCVPVKYDSIIASYIVGTLALKSSKSWNYNESLKYILTAMKFIQYGLSDFSLQNLYLTIGCYYFLNREYNSALINFKKSLEYCKQPDDIIRLYGYLCSAYILNGEFDKACDIGKQMINYQINLKTIDSIKLSRIYIDMGSIYQRLGNYKLALLYYQSAYDILQKYQNDRTHEYYSLIYICVAHIHLKYGQVQDALKFCLKSRSICALNETDITVRLLIYINLGLIQCKLENYYKSLNYFGKAWEFIFNEDSHSHIFTGLLYNYIGYAYFKLGQTEIAMNNYSKCLSLYKNCLQHPDLGEIYKNIGLIYEQEEKNYPLALSYYKQALKTVPNNKHMNYILYKSIILTLEKKMNRVNYMSYNPFRKFCCLL